MQYSQVAIVLIFVHYCDQRSVIIRLLLDDHVCPAPTACER